MRKIQNTIILGLLLALVSSCETPKAFTSKPSVESSPEARAEYNRLTRNGTTFPAAQEVTRVVSNPGSIDQECVEQAATEAPVITKSSKSGSPFVSRGKSGPYGVSLKNHPGPEKGCYPVETVSLEKAKQAIASQNFTYGPDREFKSRGPSDSEIRTFGAAVLSMQYLNGGVFTIGKPKGKMPFEYCDANKSSQQFGNRIRISRKGGAQHGLSVAQYVHEWSHLIGNSQMPGGGQVYSQFLKAIGGKVWTEDSKSGQKGCLVSRYADNRSNEHFAEVFTAFVTEPKLLKEMGKTNPVCKKAYDFFEKRMFNKGERAKECY